MPHFLFASFDPGGFVSIDKPPLGFWLQAASAKIFGFTPLSIFLPQALAGVLSVLLLYHLVRRHFGVIAGLLAALALAISPISVVTNRNNTIDSTLVLVMLLGAWAVLRAAETGKLRWLLLCAIFVGLGFNIKMLEAYLSGTSSLSPSVKRGILREKLISAFTQNCDQTALNIICL